MSRLKAPAPRLKAMMPKLVAPKDGAGRTAYRKATDPGYRLYGDRRWRGNDSGVGGLRWRILIRDGFTCRLCGIMRTDTSQLHADHLIPHKGDETLFWDGANIWTVDKDCHNTICQQIEAQIGLTGEQIREAKLSRAVKG